MSANKIITAIGKRGSGKTPLITGGDMKPGWEDTYKFFAEGLAEKYLKRGMSTLVIDEIDHVRYRTDFKMLHPDSYRKTLSNVPGKYRTLAALQHIPKLLQRIANEKLVWNTFVVWEDFHKYLNNPFQDAETILVGNSKQQNVDMFFPTWDWGFLSPDLARFTNYYIIFPTASSPEGRKHYLSGCYDKVCHAWEKVMKSSQTDKKIPYLIIDSGI